MPLSCSAATCSLATPCQCRNRSHAVQQSLYRPATYTLSRGSFTSRGVRSRAAAAISGMAIAAAAQCVPNSVRRRRNLEIQNSPDSTAFLPRQILSRSPREEFSLKQSGTSHRVEVQAFLILERVVDSKDFLVSVLLQACGQSIGKTSVGTVAEGQEILLSLRWDQPRQRFVASSEAAGSTPVLSFIPFRSPGVADGLLPADFSMTKNFVLNSGVSNNEEVPENKN